MLRSALLLVSFGAAAACSSSRSPGDAAPAPSRRVTAPGTTADPVAQWIASFPNAPSTEGVSEIIPAPADEVYARLDEAYAAAGIEVTSASSRERTLGSPDFRVTRRLGTTRLTDYVLCGDEMSLAGRLSASNPVRFSVMSTVTPSGESSELTTRVQAAVTTGERAGAILCQSTGRLEAAIARAVKLDLFKD